MQLKYVSILAGDYHASFFTDDDERTVLTEQSRDAGFSNQNLINKTIMWCYDSNVDFDYVGKGVTENGEYVNIWHIPKKDDRTMFMLKWC